MNDKLTIPKVVKVGFQSRQDTYTGKLAYIVYVDNKGVLRKEKSWDGWRDKKIDAEEFQNEPTQGFVLNKDVGGSHRSWSWNARREKVRVYDPRNFEFEISVENLLFILQECSSIKGKGLEGEFVYSWAGTELVLLPVDSHEYKSSLDFTNLQVEKVSAKDIKEGHSYITKDQKEVMYLGKFKWWEKTYDRKNREHYTQIIKGDKKHTFLYLHKNKLNEVNADEINADEASTGVVNTSDYLLVTGFTGIAKKISENPLPQFAEEFDKLSKSHHVSKPVKISILDNAIVINKDNGYGESTGIVKNGIIYTGNYSKSFWGDNKDNKDMYQMDYSDRVELKDDNVFIISTRGNSRGWGYTDQYTTDGIIKNKLTKEELSVLIKKVVVEHENGSVSGLR